MQKWSSALILEGPLQGVSSCWLKQVYENQPMTRADQESDIHSASIVEVRMNWIERDPGKRFMNLWKRGRF